MDDIRIWFNEKKDYTSGVKLYLLFGEDELLKRLFTSEGFSEFKMNRLKNELEAILNCKKPSAPAKPKVVEKEPEQIPIEKGWSDQRDDVEEALHQQWRKLYSEMINLQARVGDASRIATQNNDKAGIQEAGKLALRILDLDDMCEEIYFKRDFYKQHGRLPEDNKPVEISLDANLWYKRLLNHQRYAREFRKQLEKDPSDEKAAAFLKKHVWAVTEYKKLLKMD